MFGTELRHVTLTRPAMIQPLSPFSLPTLRGLTRAELSQRVVLELEDGSHVVLRDEYIDQLYRMCNGESGVDTAWLNCDATNVFFTTRTGIRLNVCETSSKETSTTTSAGGESMHIVLDQSGSMASMNAQVYAGARELVQDAPDDAVITLTTFNHVVTPGQRQTKQDALASLTTRTTSGTTALRDAIVTAIEYEEREPRADTTVVVVTDGMDNASARCSVEMVRNAVQRCTSRGWRVLFLGANQDAVTTASQYGIEGGRALTFDTRRAPEAFRSVTETTRARRAGHSDAFSSSQRRQASSS